MSLFGNKDNELLLQEIRALNHSITTLKGNVKELYHELFLDKNSVRARIQQVESDIQDVKAELDSKSEENSKKIDRQFQFVIGLGVAVLSSFILNFMPSPVQEKTADQKPAVKAEVVKF
jgi:hypothetical protein